MASQMLVEKFYATTKAGGLHFGVDIAKVNNLPEPLPYKTGPCFFLQRELGRTARDLYATNQYRHCKVYGHRFLDYIAKKEFDTLEEWVTDCGSTMDQVLFGYNKFDMRHSYIYLSQLMTAISPPDAEVDIITAFMNKLAVDELSLQDVHVRTFAGFIPFDTYMKE